jgi:S-(hydroxymethyl)glutathione dehydrogenase/alcohol dehydrogenase
MRPTKTKAAILTELRTPLVVEEIDLPATLAAGQVLVTIHYSGICGSQLGEIKGVKGEDKFLPHLLGHEGSGTVLEVGPGVRRVKAGDKVVLHWRKGLGIESEPPAYRWNGKKLNAGWVTTFNEHAVVSENRLTPIPADSDLEVAALFGCAVTTGFGVVVNDARIKIGDALVVYGAGGVGLNIVQAASIAGAYPIVAVDLHDNRLELARSMGATHVVNGARADVRKELDAVVPGGVDVFIDNTGVPAVIEAGYSLAKSTGTVVLVGVPAKGNNVSLYSLPLHFGKTIRGSHGGGALPHEDIPRYHGMFRAGRLKLRELVTDRFSLDDVNRAIDEMRSGKVRGRCLIRMQDSAA